MPCGKGQTPGATAAGMGDSTVRADTLWAMTSAAEIDKGAPVDNSYGIVEFYYSHINWSAY